MRLGLFLLDPFTTLERLNYRKINNLSINILTNNIKDMSKILTKLAGPIIVLADLAILVDITIDIYQKIKERRALKKAAEEEDNADEPKEDIPEPEIEE